MPCNYSGHYDPAIAAKFAIVDFDWSNQKDQWVNDSPMTCMERRANPETAVNPLTPSLQPDKRAD